MTIVKLRHEELGWQAHDPTLAEGELGLDLETGTIKLGDGTKTWAELDSHILGAGSGSSQTILHDAGVPDNGDGEDEQFYLDTDTGDLYVKVEGSWT